MSRYPLTWKRGNDRRNHENLYRYTSFLVGRHFSWTYIFRSQAQFLHARTKKGNKLAKIMDKIDYTFHIMTDAAAMPFCIWRGEQKAIGELMTSKEENGDQFCLGYAAFHQKWENDGVFQSWFGSLVTDIDSIADAYNAQENQNLPPQEIQLPRGSQLPRVLNQNPTPDVPDLRLRSHKLPMFKL
ncbi:hypothetical protein BGZ68_000740 [Mortierella alpina]|nr:hypothetical protein BGZ68_000740 [Mortierella alpina]